MKRRTILTAAVAAGMTLTFGVRAAPPEGKGQGGNAHGKGNKGGGKDDRGGAHGGKGGASSARGDTRTDLIHAGITVAMARGYAVDAGLVGYSALPPGIRKNLARGKPLPPGIAKKLVPGPLLARLPRYDGYEWRVAGTDLILVALGTAIVADVLLGVFN